MNVCEKYNACLKGLLFFIIRARNLVCNDPAVFSKEQENRTGARGLMGKRRNAATVPLLRARIVLKGVD